MRLSMAGVRHSYGDVEVLKGIELSIPDGELFALLGPSGSGKTTLLAIAGGLLTPSAGRVTLSGESAFVLQSGSLVPFLTVRENLLVRSVIRGAKPRPADADAILDSLGLAGKADRHPAKLSGGERQRVCVGQALYTRAPVVLADEPTASLDRAGGRAVMELLAAHAHTTGAAVVVATHDERSLDLTDRTVNIEDGLLDWTTTRFPGDSA